MQGSWNPFQPSQGKMCQSITGLQQRDKHSCSQLEPVLGSPVVCRGLWKEALGENIQTLRRKTSASQWIQTQDPGVSNTPPCHWRLKTDILKKNIWMNPQPLVDSKGSWTSETFWNAAVQEPPLTLRGSYREQCSCICEPMWHRVKINCKSVFTPQHSKNPCTFLCLCVFTSR